MVTAGVQSQGYVSPVNVKSSGRKELAISESFDVLNKSERFNEHQKTIEYKPKVVFLVIDLSMPNVTVLTLSTILISL